MLIEYIDHMGDDLAVVNAARVSFDKESEWLPRIHTGEEKVLSKKDQGLIKYLSTHGHWSPFAHTAIKVRMKMPIFVARQIMKHTTGIEYNEVSRRYVDSEPEFYVPDVWRKKADNVKQGSSDEAFTDYFYHEYQEDDSRIPYKFQHGVDRGLEDVYDDFLENVTELYKNMLEKGIAPEQARMVLPQSMYTEVIATGNLYAWANMYNQRTDSHAQKETRDLVLQLGEIIQPLFPVSWKALCY